MRDIDIIYSYVKLLVPATFINRGTDNYKTTDERAWLIRLASCAVGLFSFYFIDVVYGGG